jgi:putative membrane protein
MRTIVYLAAGLGGALHVVFFLMESVWWRRPSVHRRFGVRSAEEAETTAFALYNQGFYNLGLAIGAFVGIGLDIASDPAGAPLISFACGVMLLAAVVLVTSRRSLLPAAAIQGGPPLIALVGLVAS